MKAPKLQAKAKKHSKKLSTLFMFFVDKWHFFVDNYVDNFSWHAF